MINMANIGIAADEDSVDVDPWIPAQGRNDGFEIVFMPGMTARPISTYYSHRSLRAERSNLNAFRTQIASSLRLLAMTTSLTDRHWGNFAQLLSSGLLGMAMPSLREVGEYREWVVI
jgi:hypothetical protein